MCNCGCDCSDVNVMPMEATVMCYAFIGNPAAIIKCLSILQGVQVISTLMFSLIFSILNITLTKMRYHSIANETV